MLPLLYDCTQTNAAPGAMEYIGRLTKCEKCIVSEKINDNYTLSAVFSPTDVLIDEVQNQRFIMAKPNPFDPAQYFEIINCTYDEIGRLTVNGRHLKHMCYNNVLAATDLAMSAQSDTPEGHWNNLELAFTCNFSFSSPITEQAAMEIGYTKIDTLGRFMEEMAGAFAAEYHYNNFGVELLQSRGSKKNYVFRWDKNISSPNLTLTADEIYTHVVAYAELTAKVSGSAGDPDTEYPVQVCSNPASLRMPGGVRKPIRIYMFDAADQFESTEIYPRQGGYEQAKSILNAAATSFARDNAYDSPKRQLQTSEAVSLKINFCPRLDEMQAVGLGDTIDVMLKGGRTVEAKITKTEYDTLAERWTSIELGEEKIKLSKYIAKRR